MRIGFQWVFFSNVTVFERRVWSMCSACALFYNTVSRHRVDLWFIIEYIILVRVSHIVALFGLKNWNERE